jgi:hypothetical protein
LKTDFFTPPSDSWSQRFRKVATFGFGKAVSAHAPQGHVTADGRLRDAHFSRLAFDFESTAVEGCEGARTACIESLQGLQHAIRESPSRGLPTSVNKDAESLLVLMIAGVDGGVFASAANEACEALTNPEMQHLV